MNDVIHRCSNCGKVNVYSHSKYESREETKCQYCGHSLSICRWLI